MLGLWLRLSVISCIAAAAAIEVLQFTEIAHKDTIRDKVTNANALSNGNRFNEENIHQDVSSYQRESDESELRSLNRPKHHLIDSITAIDETTQYIRYEDVRIAAEGASSEGIRTLENGVITNDRRYGRKTTSRPSLRPSQFILNRPTTSPTTAPSHLYDDDDARVTVHKKSYTTWYIVATIGFFLILSCACYKTCYTMAQNKICNLLLVKFLLDSRRSRYTAASSSVIPVATEVQVSPTGIVLPVTSPSNRLSRPIDRSQGSEVISPSSAMFAIRNFGSPEISPSRSSNRCTGSFVSSGPMAAVAIESVDYSPAITPRSSRMRALVLTRIEIVPLPYDSAAAEEGDELDWNFNGLRS